MKDKSISSTRPSSIVVGFDEHCKICQKSARFFKFFNWSKKIIFDGAHNPKSELLQRIPKIQRVQKIYAVELQTRIVHTGYDVIGELIKRLPLGFLFRPFIFLFKKTGLGDYIYNKVAAASWRKQCKDGVCRRGFLNSALSPATKVKSNSKIIPKPTNPYNPCDN